MLFQAPAVHHGKRIESKKLKEIGRWIREPDFQYAVADDSDPYLTKIKQHLPTRFDTSVEWVIFVGRLKAALFFIDVDDEYPIRSGCAFRLV
jgi:hypothetical protein